MLESIKELRELAGRCVGGMGGDYLRHIADKLEAEVAERYVALPTDADGEVIHIGGVMDFSKNVTNLVVLGFGVASRCNVGRDLGVFVIEDKDYIWYNAKFLRHYHEPTVEDVLEEYRVRYYDLVTDMECKNITNDEYAQGIKSLNTEYAARLRLAGDVE